MSINVKNKSFWDTVCGSILAEHFNIKKHDKKSLDQYDIQYFKYYPYLEKYIPFKNMKKKRVLEIGVGYGSLSQKLFEIDGIDYTAIDIAKKPINLLKKRIGFSQKISGKTTTLNKNFLTCDFKKKRFDFIVAIGSLHHTGNLLSAIKKCYDLLEKNGILIGMVYSAVSYRRWVGNFTQTLKLTFSKNELSFLEMDEDEKKKYDTNFLNQVPPATEFTTKAKMKLILNKFNEKKLYYENLNGFYPNYHITRKLLLKTFFPKIFGTDLYFLCTKI